MSDSNSTRPLARNVRMKLEQVLLNRIKFIGDDEQIYTGCPRDLLNELFGVVRREFYYDVGRGALKEKP